MLREPLLEAGDIQGKVAPGFNRSVELYWGAQCSSADGLRQLLAGVLRNVTTMRTTHQFRSRIRQVRLGNIDPSEVDAGPWLCVSLSSEALRMVDCADVAKVDRALELGLAKRAFGLGDPRSQDSAFHPRNWVIGGTDPQKVINVLVIVAGDDRAEVSNAEAEWLDPLAAHAEVEVRYREIGHRLSGDGEHFGFRDGISQPGLRGLVSLDPQVFLATRYIDTPTDPNRVGPDFARPGQPLVWPGQVIFGYHRQSQTRAIASVPEPPTVHPKARNGSLMVFRRLTQDVRQFYEDTQGEASRVGGLAGFDGMTPQRLRALIVGRWPSGAPLVRHPERDNPDHGADHKLNNYFAYSRGLSDEMLLDGSSIGGSSSDPFGQACPITAHIRQVNPRDRDTDQGPSTRTLAFLFARRGIPFGPAYNHDDPNSVENAEERGLLFVSFQTSIPDQFELVQKRWMNRPAGPEPEGFDLLVGQRASGDRTRSAKLLGRDGRTATVKAMHDYVSPSGGEYLFTPSLRLLRAIAAGN